MATLPIFHCQVCRLTFSREVFSAHRTQVAETKYVIMGYFAMLSNNEDFETWPESFWWRLYSHFHSEIFRFFCITCTLNSQFLPNWRVQVRVFYDKQNRIHMCHECWNWWSEIQSDSFWEQGVQHKWPRNAGFALGFFFLSPPLSPIWFFLISLTLGHLSPLFHKSY